MVDSQLIDVIRTGPPKSRQPPYVCSPGLRSAKYCSRQCQAQDWKAGHKDLLYLQVPKTTNDEGQRPIAPAFKVHAVNSRVKLHGFSAAHMNGMKGIIESSAEAATAGRFVVRILGEERTVKVKRENIRPTSRSKK